MREGLRHRDVQLDMYRGAFMIYITSLTHMIYGLRVLDDSAFTSMMLFDLPMIFFISGAAYNISFRPERTYRSFVYSKVKRLIVPYYIYIMVSLIAFALIGWIAEDVCGLNLWYFKRISGEDLWRVLTLRDSEIFPFFYHVWFIIPFFVICCLAPFFRKVIARSKGGVCVTVLFMIALVGIFDLTDVLSSLPVFYEEQIRYVVVYSSFFLCGFLYKQETGGLWVYMAVAGLILMAVLNMFCGYSLDIQANKFPPNLYFCVFGVCSIALLSLLLPKIKLPRLKVFDHFSKNSYTIYLYQNITLFIIGIAVFGVCLRGVSHVPAGLKALLFLGCAVASLGINYCMSKATVKIESFFMSLWERLTTRKG